MNVSPCRSAFLAVMPYFLSTIGFSASEWVSGVETAGGVASRVKPSPASLVARAPWEGSSACVCSDGPTCPAVAVVASAHGAEGF